MIHRLLAALLALSALAALPAPAAAQVFGIGPRFSFVRGDLTTDTPSTSFKGGTIRMRTSKHMELEAAVDYRSQISDDHTSRLREVPIQASILIYPVRAAFSPYLLGGFGVYSQFTDALDVTGKVTATTLDRKTGWHLGGGADIFIGRHAAFFADYRFRFVQLGAATDGSEAINIPGASVIPGLSNVKLSHQGSMWTSGMAFYF